MNGESSNDKRLNVLDPSKGQVLDTVPHGTKDDVGKAVDAARDAFDKGIWSKIPPGERANLLLKVASMLEQKSDEFIKLECANSIQNYWFSIWYKGKLFMYMSCKKQFFGCYIQRTDHSWTDLVRIKSPEEWQKLLDDEIQPVCKGIGNT